MSETTHEKCWHEPQQYTFTAVLDSAGWAWEFLRRNPEYRRDWAWFRATWDTLEARYGKAPNRDFVRWKKDPDAYRSADDSAGDCRADCDRLLIECWMGEKWGFYKFPLDPASERPQAGLQLHWREVEQVMPVVEDAASPYLEPVDTRIALGFDLDMPLREQLERAKRLLQARQGRLRRSGAISMQTVAGRRGDWTLMLRILDGVASGADLIEIARVLGAGLQKPLQEADITALHERAQALMQGGYRRLLQIPD